MSDDDEIRRNRRAFFRQGFQSIREAVLETAHEVTKAAGELSDIATEAIEEEPKSFHRARVRGPSAVGNRPIRPPGAIEESMFLERCSRCHHCIEACPEGAIFKAGPQHGPAVELSPIMEVTQRACVLCDGVPCAAACLNMSGAEVRAGHRSPIPTPVGIPWRRYITAGAREWAHLVGGSKDEAAVIEPNLVGRALVGREGGLRVKQLDHRPCRPPAAVALDAVADLRKEGRRAASETQREPGSERRVDE